MSIAQDRYNLAAKCGSKMDYIDMRSLYREAMSKYKTARGEPATVDISSNYGADVNGYYSSTSTFDIGSLSMEQIQALLDTADASKPNAILFAKRVVPLRFVAVDSCRFTYGVWSCIVKWYADPNNHDAWFVNMMGGVGGVSFPPDSVMRSCDPSIPKFGGINTGSATVEPGKLPSGSPSYGGGRVISPRSPGYTPPPLIHAGPSSSGNEPPPDEEPSVEPAPSGPSGLAIVGVLAALGLAGLGVWLATKDE